MEDYLYEDIVPTSNIIFYLFYYISLRYYLASADTSAFFFIFDSLDAFRLHWLIYFPYFVLDLFLTNWSMLLTSDWVLNSSQCMMDLPSEYMTFSYIISIPGSPVPQICQCSLFWIINGIIAIVDINFCTFHFSRLYGSLFGEISFVNNLLFLAWFPFSLNSINKFVVLLKMTYFKMIALFHCS